MEFSEAIVSVVKKNYFTFSGRAARSEYWWFQLFLLLVTFMMLIPMGFYYYSVGRGDEGSSVIPAVFGIAYFLFFISMLVPIFAVTSRRFHDINKSGWWVLVFAVLNVIPYLNIVSGIVMLIFLVERGSALKNRFGDSPLSKDGVGFSLT